MTNIGYDIKQILLFVTVSQNEWQQQNVIPISHDQYIGSFMPVMLVNDWQGLKVHRSGTEIKNCSCHALSYEIDCELYVVSCHLLKSFMSSMLTICQYFYGLTLCWTVYIQSKHNIIHG